MRFLWWSLGALVAFVSFGLAMIAVGSWDPSPSAGGGSTLSSSKAAASKGLSQRQKMMNLSKRRRAEASK